MVARLSLRLGHAVVQHQAPAALGIQGFEIAEEGLRRARPRRAPRQARVRRRGSRGADPRHNPVPPRDS